MSKYLTVKQVQRLAYLVNKVLRENPTKRGKWDLVEPGAWETALKKAVNGDGVLPKYRTLERSYGDILEFLIYYFGDAIEAESDKKDDAARRKVVKAGGGSWRRER
jgi:hypothetical protein